MRAGLLASTLALLVACAPANLWSQQLGRQKDLTQQGIQTLRDQIAELDGRAIIGFKPASEAQGMRPDGTPALSAGAVSRLADSLRPLGVSVHRQFNIIPAVAVRLDPDRLEALLANPEIDYVEPDFENELYAPSDVTAAAVVQDIPWGITRVDAAGAWPFTKGAGVKVGIIDTGIDENHPDLNPLGGVNVVTGGTTRNDWDDNSPYCPTHGTHVAGTVAALDNTIGVVGVAPEADLYAVRVFDPGNSGTAPGCYYLDEHLILALQWSVENSLDVVNMSIGGRFPSIAVSDALFAAFQAGVLPVAASGNDYGAVGYPGGFSSVIGVGATDEADNRVSFSNYGPELDVTAPGIRVLSTVGGGGYESWQGTSMATPHVTGVAALVRAARPDLGPDDVRQILYSTADDVNAPGFDVYTGWGVVQAGAAVNAVASTNLALSLIPGSVSLAAEPGGSSVMTSVEVRNVGAAGTINWTATADASWIGLSPTAGTATESTPGSLDVTADPTGLSVGLHTGFITVSGNAANSPAQVQVRFVVAERIPLDAAVATAGYVPTGGRARYLLSGTAGQQIDVAVVADESHSTPLYDPNVRIYHPDGERLLAFNEDAVYAGLWYQALVYGVTLPANGDYIVEVGSYLDCCSGGFLLKARPAGPILGFNPYVISERGEENGAPEQIPLDVINLSGTGTLDWTASSPQSWITIDPASGAVSQTGQPVAMADLRPTEREIRREVPEGDQDTRPGPQERVRRDVLEGFGLSKEKLEESGLASLGLAIGPQFEAPTLDAEVQAMEVMVILDGAGLPLGWNIGDILFEPADGWLSPTIPVGFSVYSEGMEIVSSGHYLPRDMTTDDTRPGDPPVIAATADNGGSLFPIASDGTVGAPVATGFNQYPGGLTLGQDANWYVGSRAFDYKIIKVTRDGASSDFVTLPSTAFYMGWGPPPDGDLYATACNVGRVYRISLDGSAFEQIGPSLSCPSGIAYRPQDNSLYVANGWATGMTRIPLDDPNNTSSVATNAEDVLAVAVGMSGTVYFTDDPGNLWSIDPAVATQATLLAVTPADVGLKGLDVAEGALMMASYDWGEFYRYPVDDEPIPHPSEFLLEDIVAYLDVSEIDAAQGEAFEVPLVLASTDESDLQVAGYRNELNWQATELNYSANRAGDFGGSFVANDTEADQGVFRAVTARATDVAVPLTTLFWLTYELDASLEPGQCADISILFHELVDETGADLLPSLYVETPASIGMGEGKGDVTGDGSIGAADAVQILRWLVGLPICEGCDISNGDTNCDGEIAASDAVVILRWLVGLPVGDACVGIPRIGPCPQ
jgi:subtilisin family serine protease